MDASTDHVIETLRTPPHSKEAEQAILGGLLSSPNNDAWDKVADILTQTDFYHSEHRIIWQAIQKLILKNQAVDILTVHDLLVQQEEIEHIGGLSYLATLAQNTPSAANIRRYGEIVREHSVRRQLILAATEIADSAHSPKGYETAQLLDNAESRLFQITEQSARGKQGFISINDLLVRATDQIEQLYNNKNADGVTGIPTGFIDLDRLTAGLQRGDLIIVAGRPSMGKTAFSLNIAENVALQTQLPVGVFSMEMPAMLLVMRMIGSVGQIDQNKLRTGEFNDKDWAQFSYALGVLAETKIQIDETPGLTVTEVRARARRLARQFGGHLGVIVIDYLQLMSGTGQRGEQNRTAEISEITRSLKGLARELDVPIIALSQLNRSVEQRPDKRPMMSDLRESGAIEQDADLIMFLYRDEYYNPNPDPNSPTKGLAELIIAKHRNGPTGKVFLTFMGHHSRFENAAHRNGDYHTPPPEYSQFG